MFLKLPKSRNPLVLEHIPLLMDLYEENFFIHEFGKLKTANLIFEIYSPVGRGRSERVMISIVSFDDEYNLRLSSFQEIMEYFAFQFKQIKDIYKGFYSKNILGAPEGYNKIKDLFYSFYQSIPKARAIFNQKISKILTYELSPKGKNNIIEFLQKKFSESGQRIREFTIPYNFKIF